MRNSKRKQAPVTSDNIVRNTPEIESMREHSKQQFLSSLDSICERYGKDVDDDCDIIEMFPHMHIVVDRGHLHSLNDEESDAESDEELEEIDTASYQEPGNDDGHSTSEDEPMNEFDDSMIEGPCEMEVGAETFKGVFCFCNTLPRSFLKILFSPISIPRGECTYRPRFTLTHEAVFVMEF